jgi:hypothetical protein
MLGTLGGQHILRFVCIRGFTEFQATPRTRVRSGRGDRI